MIKFRLLLFAICVLASVSYSLAAEPEVRKYSVKFSDAVKKKFPAGFPLAVGSGLVFRERDSEGVLSFLGITDRGPSARGPRFELEGEKFRGKFFAAPDFSPSLCYLTLAGEEARVDRIVPIRWSRNRTSTGLPPDSLGGEAALNSGLEQIPYDENGIDPEGVTVDGKGAIWAVEEYAPSLLKIDPGSGKIVKKLIPGSGLPQVFKFIQHGKGFEGVTVAPDGVIYAVVQSVLDINGETKDTASFIRILSYHPVSRKTEMFAYPLDSAVGRRAGVKLSAVQAVDSARLLAVEKSRLKDGAKTSRVVLINLTGASDLSGKKYRGRELEYASSAAQIFNGGKSGASSAKIEELFKFEDLGIDGASIEGITLLDDSRTIAVVNDSDFGVNPVIDLKVEDFTVNEAGALSYRSKKDRNPFKLKLQGGETFLWLIKLPGPLISRSRRTLALVAAVVMVLAGFVWIFCRKLT